MENNISKRKTLYKKFTKGLIDNKEKMRVFIEKYLKLAKGKNYLIIN